LKGFTSPAPVAAKRPRPAPSGVHRAALAALLAVPVLAVPAWTAPASAAPAKPAGQAPSCPLPGPVKQAGLQDRVEALIGNLSPAAGSAVGAGATISFLVADEVPFPTPLSGDVVVTVNGASVTVVAGAGESGVPITYANPRDKGSQSTDCEVPFSFALPSSISGSAHIRVVARDGDGNVETVRWTLTVQTTALPNGAVGGIGVAAIGGLVLMVVQVRRRRGSARAVRRQSPADR
jgi:hypothetical protein